ncbi:MAG: GNAT family N-acetyltransferase [Chloroflexota bacterium]|nr:GNAT family N-acetyltransferase [Chloroflexota bacterium]
MTVRIRNYREGDLPALVSLINEADAVDGMERGTSLQELEQQFARPTLLPERDVFLAEVGSVMVAYSYLITERDDLTCVFHQEGEVHPEWRRQGIGTQMMNRTMAAAKSRREELDEQTVYTSAGCVAGEEDRESLFRSFGMNPARYFMKMTYEPLDDRIPSPQPPSGIVLRSYAPDKDGRAVWAAVNEAFRDHWGHVEMTLEEWTFWMKSPFFRPELHVLAVDGREIAGVSLIVINEEENNRTGRWEGWIDTLCVRRPYRRRGVGKALLLAGVRQLREAGMEMAALGADTENLTGAVRLYERAGFHETRRWVNYRTLLNHE